MSLSPAFTTALSILPQALLPLSIILSLSLLPFKGRGILCTVVIASIVYLTFVSPWPSEAQMRYGIMNSWFYYLPVVQKLICGVPEEEVWRVGARSHGGRIDRKREADEVTGTEKEALEMGFGWKKIQWAAELYANPRGVGWNFIVKSIPPPKYTNSQRTRFLIHQVAGFCLSYLLVDAGIAFVNAYGVENALNGSWRDRFVVGSAYALVIRSNWKLMWYFWSLIGVGIGVSRPANWPSLFGSLGDCTTVGGFWGRYWQGILHHVSLLSSRVFLEFFCVANFWLLVHTWLQ
ncbi:uncharacterized protein BDR25DRAFT_22498 [Lindgomyces ingoldianus]|uniref:Uncharacterized protein n=1 Tax=Lindgomyces ingoldianus TaxID=673940 RepID=A0ACB6R065_9PLEO|nr:uncharacterized protein BDR25DRAFT_22498 [Lindgomyces ingoldianus]KAF2471727.1 hypothetical protein BDR25DRAFT_22498 [Lindgomyces ingoldianus]